MSGSDMGNPVKNFDAEAASWDTAPRIERARLVAGEIRRSIHLQKKWDALEFGSGTGLVGFNLADDLGSITMLDSSAGMIAEAKRKVGELGAKNVSALHAEIGTLAEEDRRFDFIFSSMALHHIPDTAGIIRTFRRLLRPGGILCVVDLDTVDPAFHGSESGFDGHHGFSRKELADVLTENGFCSCESHTFFRDTKKKEGGDVPYSLFLMSGTACC